MDNLKKNHIFMLVLFCLLNGCFKQPGMSLYPNGDVFCFTFYSMDDKDILFALNNGATAIGPYYKEQDLFLGKSTDYGCNFIYKVRPACMVDAKANIFDDPNYGWPSDQEIIEDTIEVIERVIGYQHIAIWDIAPEELRPWEKKEMNYLKLVSSTIRKYDSKNRPVMMYEPGHRNADQLAKTVAFQDICGKGTYVETKGFKNNRIWVRWSMEQELNAIAKSNVSAVPWIVLWMARDAKSEEFELIHDWCRHDAYLGLIMGGKGMQIWSGRRGRQGFSDKHLEEYLDGYLSVARDLNTSPLNLSSVFLHGLKQDDVKMDVTDGPEFLKLEYPKGEFNYYSPISYLCMKYNGFIYLFIVNSAQDAVTATFSNVQLGNIENLFSGEISDVSYGSFSVTLESLEVKAYKFSNLPKKRVDKDK